MCLYLKGLSDEEIARIDGIKVVSVRNWRNKNKLPEDYRQYQPSAVDQLLYNIGDWITAKTAMGLMVAGEVVSIMDERSLILEDETGYRHLVIARKEAEMKTARKDRRPSRA